LIKTADYQLTDPAADAYIQQIYDEFSVLGNRKVATSEVDLIIADADENRLVRRHETNLGDLCADAFRSVTGADIGYINGGNLRAGISAGDITYNQMLDVLPFNNTVVLAEISGQTLKDMMEMAMMSWPSENGSFPHLSGLTFSVNTSIPSSVILDEQDEFVTVAGQYRVYDMKVFNRESGKYEPIVLNKKYTIASHNYALIDHGSGMKMLENTVVLKNDGILDVEALERHIVEDLGGNIGSKYAEAEVNITFTEGEVTSNEPSPDTGDTSHAAMWIAIAVVAVAVIVFLKRRGGKKAE
jgi:LPXTG-motif cell wall-anchored protein